MPHLPSLGALLTTELETHHLGAVHGRRLTAHTRRRTLRLALGERTALRWSLTRLRPTAIEVHELGSVGAPGRSYHLPVQAPPDPLLRAARRIAALWAAAAATRLLAARLVDATTWER